MFDERTSPCKWKAIRPDIVWCAFPECDDEHALVVWPNMQVSREVSRMCHDAFKACIIGREHETLFHGCVLNAKTQQVDAIFGVHRDDMPKTFFMSTRQFDRSDYDFAATSSSQRRHPNVTGADTVFGFNF